MQVNDVIGLSRRGHDTRIVFDFDDIDVIALSKSVYIVEILDGEQVAQAVAPSSSIASWQHRGMVCRPAR